MDKLDVAFGSEISKFDNCLCTACHATDRVMKIKMPQTLYHDGKRLTTKYYEWWLCARCRTKLSHALDWPKEEVVDG